MKTCLSIAGSDSSGGAGIQADLKTFTALGVYGMTAITALTAQNTQGVHGVSVVNPKFVAAQIDAVFNDIRPDAIKIGMLANAEIIDVVAERLHFHQAHNIVLDPVMIATSGDSLLDQQATRSLVHHLIPCADLITPNTAELIALCQEQGIKVKSEIELTKERLKELTQLLFNSLPKHESQASVSILSKGGHLTNDQASDYLLSSKGEYWFESARVKTTNTHGTGCTLSAAIASHLARGYSLNDSCSKAKKYLSSALNKGLDLGKGNGPLNHFI